MFTAAGFGAFYRQLFILTLFIIYQCRPYFDFPCLVFAHYFSIYSVAIYVGDMLYLFLPFYYISGDFGNENVELVKTISNLNMPKAAILGNHDSWSTRQFNHK